jgi:uncharacterized membrane protein
MIAEKARMLVQNERAPQIGLLCITVLGAILRAYRLGSKPLWFDEAVVFWIAQRPLPELIAHNAVENSAPPLFAVVVSLISRASTSEAFLRIIPWLAGTLVIPAMYLLARQFLSKGASLITAFMIAIAPSQIQYSQQLREYSLSVLFSIVILLGVANFLEKESWGNAAILATAMVIAVFLQYGLALTILAANVLFLGFILISRRLGDRDLLLRWTLVQGIGLLSALAVYFLALKAQIQPGGFASSGHLSSSYWTGTSLMSAAQFVYGGARDLIAFTFPGYVFTLLIYAGSLILLVNYSRSLYPFLIAVPIATVVLASILRYYPLIGGRQDLFLTPLIFLVAGTAFDYLVRIDKKLLLVALLAALVAWRAIPSLRSYYSGDGEGAIGKLVARVAAMAAPGEPIYICLPLDPVLRYYIQVRYPLPDNPLIEGVRGPGRRDYLDQVDSMLAEYRTAWILTYQGCGDVTPLIDHISRTWNVDLVDKRYPEAQLFFVH